MKVLFFVFLFLGIWGTVNATNIDESNYVSTITDKGYFSVSTSTEKASMVISSADFTGVIRAFNDLKDDI